MTRRTVPGALLALLVSVVLTACGGGDEAGSSGGEWSTAVAEEVSADLSVAPEAPATDAEPPTELVVEDVVVGDGAEAVDGSTVAVKYVGAFYETGEEFDSSWSRSDDETLPVTLGAGQVIPGFEQGITGMQVGGRRAIAIPSELGYGDQARGPIPADATLVFVVDLVEVAG
ncbi:FKBP-type peptidyl-prolyl cis-trans isomerase [Blastococcus sp. VKM Ac-2987]|uniref:FKBP-type peptidyl-prolyl cis-trans isomerase n=1 Tax=Blastococcus sp. VKM Ac-2987 TaxID=3004141 RepID=UPI0022AB5191|nr:FKBP-type peptidyl-prolyl cis-trans isomerase [Blastococcus sp. VKM Ac-2987]MCZ2858326.1 FKBP-type peptidyl-prolyl cis-trans isomerase [Blastococcus sp. VKM Ac-2987]